MGFGDDRLMEMRGNMLGQCNMILDELSSGLLDLESVFCWVLRVAKWVRVYTLFLKRWCFAT